MGKALKRVWRYEPADNKTPLNHPTIGHLTFGTEYTHPDCVTVPGMVEITEKAAEKVADRPPEKPAGPIAPEGASEPSHVAAKGTKPDKE